jgi:hypothetical protein
MVRDVEVEACMYRWYDPCVVRTTVQYTGLLGGKTLLVACS